MINYLALGDSYTIGEKVLLAESFPYQLVQILRKENLSINAPEIIAKTGWTSADLLNGINETALLKYYDFVTLLIGVNNQYDGKNIEDFKIEFEQLLKLSVNFTGYNSNHVLVLSVPDWGITPFAESRDKEKISQEINAYNNICRNITEYYNCTFLEITQAYKQDAGDRDFVAADGLHPSPKEYAKWAKKTAEKILEML
jgi:lysophospholipase L1-like esterase